MSGQQAPDGGGRRPGLDRAQVLSAALHVVDREGLEALSMRRLGRELGVEAMSVYNHVPDKDAILDGICEVMLAEIEPSTRSGDWRASARHYSEEFRRVGRRHPTAFGLFATRRIGAYAASHEMSEAILRELGDAGFSEVDAVQVYRTLVRYTLGFTLAEVASADERAASGSSRALAQHPRTARLIDAVESDDQEQLFTFGLEALLFGFDRRRARGG